MDAKDQIKARLPLEDIISETVALKPAGKDHLKGQCPFHADKTPSFFVSTDKGLYRCFGCEESGDVFSFVQKTQNLNFREALELLAQRVGIKLTDGRANSAPKVQPQAVVRPIAAPEPKTQAAETPMPASWINDLVSAAHEALVRGETKAAQAAQAYFEGRGLGGLVEGLRLGVVDESVKVPQAGWMLGRFRERALIPTLEGDRAVFFRVRDISGRSAEELKEAEVRKYDGPSGSIPSPFNPVGLEHAREAGAMVLCEGEADAASLLAAFGLKYPVLGLPGGNLPKGWSEQIAAAKVPVYLAMDPDEAGALHAEKLEKELSGLGVNLYRLHLTADVNELLLELGDGFADFFNDLLETATRKGISDILYVRETWLAELDARARRPHATYTTGLEALDTLLDGGYAEGLHLLGGITGGGKTSFALQVAAHNAAAGRPVIFASYEQPRLELWARIAVGLTKVPYTAIKRGTYDDHGQDVLTSSQLKNDEGWGKLEAVAKHLKIVEGGDALSRSTSSYTVEVLAATARAMAEAHGAPPLIIIDYLQRAPAPVGAQIRDVRERVGAVAGLLQMHLAREVGCPVLALSSIGRASYKQLQESSIEDRLAAFKEAGELEYTAYTALLVYGLSEKLQDDLNLAPGMTSTFKPMTLDLVKNREGTVGRVGVQWHAARGAWNGSKSIKERSQ